MFLSAEATAGDRVFIYELSALSRGGGGRQTQVLTSPLLNSSFSASIAAFDSYVAVGAPRRAGLRSNRFIFFAFIPPQHFLYDQALYTYIRAHKSAALVSTL